MSFDSEQLKARLLDDNLARSALSDNTRTLIADATSRAEVTEMPDGTPVLRHGDTLLGADFDPTSLLEVVQRAGSPVTFVVFGLGMGHTVRGLRAYTKAPLVVFEPDPGNVRTYFESGPSDLTEVHIVCTNHDLNQLWQRLSNGKQNVTLVNTPGYAAHFPEQAQHVREEVGQLVQRSGVNDATHRLRARTWIQDVFANLELLREHPTFLALTGKYRGVPAFIVGAGPSLGKNGRLLAEATKKGIVFAVNSSARALDSYGVEPQVLACMESIDVSPLFEKVSYIDRVVRAISLTGHPRTLRTGAGPLLPIFEGIQQQNVPLTSLLGYGGLSVSGSVSTLAFSLAVRLGCSPIVLVGQDLAYTDGRAYAEGTAYEGSRVRLAADGQHLEHDWCETLKSAHNQGDNQMVNRQPMLQVAAWGGAGSVFSTIGFSSVRAWFEAAFLVMAKDRPETRLANATEGGARIAGFEEITLAELLATLPEHNITANSISEDAARVGPIGSERLSSWCNEQSELARKVRHAARRLRRLGEASLNALNENTPSRIARSFEKLDVAELALKEAVRRMPFVDAWAHTEIGNLAELGDAAPETRDDRERALRAVALELSYAGVIEDAAREIERQLAALAARFGTPSAASTGASPHKF